MQPASSCDLVGIARVHYCM